jgi:hypothetical protein
MTEVSIAAVLNQSLRTWHRAARPRSHREFIGSLVYPGGPKEGQHQDPDNDPVQRWLIDQMDLGCWRSIAWLGAPQLTGKTEVAIKLPLLRAAIECRLPVGYALPTLDSLDSMYQAKIREGMQKSGYGDYFPEKGPGSRGGKPPFLRLRDPRSRQQLGAFHFMTPGAFGSTAAVIIVDDVDQLRKADGTPDWSGLRDLWARADSYDKTAQSLRICCGTIEHDSSSIIWELAAKRGTGTRLHARCPYCAAHQILSRKNLRYDATDAGAARETAHLVCRVCDKPWRGSDHEDALYAGLFVHRGQEVQDGRVAGPEPRTGGALGLITTAYDCVRMDPADLAEELVEAQRILETTGDHSLARKYTRYRDCHCYVEDRQEEQTTAPLSPQYLSARSRAFGFADLTSDREEERLWSCHYTPVPEEAQALAVACDVQQDRIYWQATAYERRTWQEWDVGWGYETHRYPMEPWGEGDAFCVTFRRFVRALAERFPGIELAHAVCDVRYRPDMVAEALKLHPVWRGIHGARSLPKAERVCIPELLSYDSRWRPGLGCYTIHTRGVRRLVHEGYRKSKDEPGCCHLPKGLKANDYYLRHLCSRLLQVNHRTNKEDWRRTQARDDLLDVKTYGHAMILRERQEELVPPKKAKVVSAAQWFGGGSR